MIDPVVPGGDERGQRVVGGGVGVGIDALGDEVAVPEVAVDVVGEEGGKGKEDEAGQDRDGPDDGGGVGGGGRAEALGREARAEVTEEGGGRKEEAGKGEGDLVEPAEEGEQKREKEAGKEELCHGAEGFAVAAGPVTPGTDPPGAGEPPRGANPPGAIAPRTATLLARTAVLIPALNEEEALPATLAALPAAALGPVVVVDNGSTDRTAALARAAGAIVVRESERGYGAACLAGIRHLSSLRPRPRAVVFVDADHPADAARIPVIVGPLARGADLALGVRTLSGGRTGNRHPHARWGNRAVLAVVRLLFGRHFRDLPPFRAIGMAALARLNLDDRNWGWTLQMQLRAVAHGLAIVEIGLPHGRRSGGRSKISGRALMTVRVGAKMLWTVAREWGWGGKP